MKQFRFPLIMPTTAEDYVRTKRDLASFFEFLPISKMVMIGPQPLQCFVEADREANPAYADRLEYLDENELIPFDACKEAMISRLAADGYQMGENSKPGWYYQQFLKLAYYEICKDQYYLTWDADTIPLRKNKMFNDKGKPYFDVKLEFIPGYYHTIRNLFGFDKVIRESFISEHMLFDKSLVAEMVTEIMSLSFCGETFYEKIFHAIRPEDMKLGFSEFETFGTWVTIRHPNAYVCRQWHSIRKAGVFVQSDDLRTNDIQWMSRDFDAATFEKYHQLIPDLAELFRNQDTRRAVSMKEFYDIVNKSGIFGEYENGMIKEGDHYMSI